MRRVTVVLVAALAGVCALPASGGPDAFSFVQVTEKEFTLTLSRQSVRAGSVSVEVVNFGMDNHDLVVKGMKVGSKPFQDAYSSASTRSQPSQNCVHCAASSNQLIGCRLSLASPE